MIDSLSRTRPWVSFLGVMAMIGCGLLVLVGLGMFALGNTAGLSEGMGPLAGGALGAVYLLMAVLYFFPGLYLLRYAGAIKRIGPANPAAMEEALDSQATFWRYVGIMTAVVVIIYIVAIVGIAIMAAIGAAAAGG